MFPSISLNKASGATIFDGEKKQVLLYSDVTPPARQISIKGLSGGGPLYFLLELFIIESLQPRTCGGIRMNFTKSNNPTAEPINEEFIKI